MDPKLKKGIMAVFIANVINVVFSLATNFLLPKYLSVESYASIKTFQLYVSYVGLFHLGYVDGMYLKYGGFELSQSVDKSFSDNLATMQFFQGLITIAAACLALLCRDYILFLFTVSIFPQNVSNYFRFLYQATGQFKTYGRFMYLSTIFTFLINALLLILKIDNYKYYIVSYVVVYYVIWSIIEIHFRKNHTFQTRGQFNIKHLITSVKDGFLLMLGTIASMLLTSMDRWFVKFFMDILAFAQYSFAVSVESFLNLAITPITTTLYNFFCRENDIEKHRQILRYVIVFATILPATAFPVKFILEIFLTKYIDSGRVIFLLFSAQIFYIIIRSVYINLYKVQRKQKTYFWKLVTILIIGFVLNAVCFLLLHTKEAFAIGTLLSAIFWFVITANDFRYIKLSLKEYIYIFSELGVFLFCGFSFNSIIGCILYILATCILIIVFMRDIVRTGTIFLKKLIYRR